jgi:hypothetical protein
MSRFNSRVAKLERRAERQTIDARGACLAGARLYIDGVPLPESLSPRERGLALYYASVLRSVDQNWFTDPEPLPLPADPRSACP